MPVKVVKVMETMASRMIVSTILLLALSLMMLKHSILRYINFIIPEIFILNQIMFVIMFANSKTDINI